MVMDLFSANLAANLCGHINCQMANVYEGNRMASIGTNAKVNWTLANSLGTFRLYKGTAMISVIRLSQD